MIADSHQSSILCCICGAVVSPPNNLAQCQSCIKETVNLTENLELNFSLFHCKHCDRYKRPPWVACDWESPGLLALCLKQMKKFNCPKEGIRLVHAEFVYTEPHSKQIAIAVRLQKELSPGVVVEQKCQLNGRIHSTQCEDCQKSYTPHTYVAAVQLRQHVEHKLTLMYLEQLILKHAAHQKVLYTEEAPDGLDFFFGSKSAAQQFVTFLSASVPAKVKQSKTLISHDANSNQAVHKYSFSVDVCPMCKDDLVIGQSKHGESRHSNRMCLMICLRVTSYLQFLNPFTGRQISVAAPKFFKEPFETVLSRGQMTEFLVLNVERIDGIPSKKFLKISDKPPMEDDAASAPSEPAQKYALARIDVARQAHDDLKHYSVVSHLGNVLKPGDYCLGYDLTTLNVSSSSLERLLEEIPEDIVLVKKLRSRPRSFNWVIQRLEVTRSHADNHRRDKEVLYFKQHLEEDSHLANDVKCYKKYEVSIEDEGAYSDLCKKLISLTVDDVKTGHYE